MSRAAPTPSRRAAARIILYAGPSVIRSASRITGQCARATCRGRFLRLDDDPDRRQEHNHELHAGVVSHCDRAGLDGSATRERGKWCVTQWVDGEKGRCVRTGEPREATASIRSLDTTSLPYAILGREAILSWLAGDLRWDFDRISTPRPAGPHGNVTFGEGPVRAGTIERRDRN